MSKRLFTINEYKPEEVLQLDAAYNQSFEHGFLKAGKAVSGTLLSKEGSHATFSTYGKSNVIVPMTSEEGQIINNLVLGDKINILITDVVEAKNDYVVWGSISQMKQNEVRDFLEKAYSEGTVLTARILQHNSGGFICEVLIEDVLVNIFMPHVAASLTRIENVEEWIDRNIDIILDKATRDNRTSFICSHKKFLNTQIPAETAKLVSGGEYNGQITGKTDFAIFVIFNNCLTGMIHKSNLEAGLDAFTIGDKINFFVKDIIKDRLFLTQVLRESLWDSIEVGDELQGKVSSIKDFGIMVQLDYETKGLLHRSTLKGRSPDEWDRDETIFVKVTAVNKSNRQITLALN